MQPLGVYISVPFCKAKCTFCNFASGAFAPGRMGSYTERLCWEIAGIRERAQQMGALLPESIDSVYFGGGTPSLLAAGQMRAIFKRLRSVFHVEHCAEITLECAPGQLSDATLEELLRQGMTRISFGVQSFVDAEAAAVGRLHTRAMCLAELERVRAAGVQEVSIDLIAGLPLQTEPSWRYSLEQVIATGVPHVSVYMLEVDGESRLGREALAGGRRYSASALPSEEETADWYLMACERLGAAGIQQYEISNFARTRHPSRHNLKYWRREPYAGFGLDAHSMLLNRDGAMRFQNPDDLDSYMADPVFPLLAQPLKPVRIRGDEAFEEALFLGLRLNEGVRLGALRELHGARLVDGVMGSFAEMAEAGLLHVDADSVQLTDRGRLLSNEVFERVLVTA